MEDAILAQLLGMGFEAKDIETCQREMAAREGGVYSLQAATEWLIQHQSTSSSQQGASAPGRLVLTTPTTMVTGGSPNDIQRPLSSASDLSQSEPNPLKSRYNLGDEHSRDKERFAAKEREEVVKKAREIKLADTRARQNLKQQIAEDRKERMNRPSPTESGVPHHDGPVMKPPNMSRVQIRLPDGRLLRHNFNSTARLEEVVDFVRESCHDYHSVQLVQPFPHHEFTAEEYHCSLQSLSLCPSASLVVSKQPINTVGGANGKSRPHPTPDDDRSVSSYSSHTPFDHDQTAAAASHMAGQQNNVTFSDSSRSEFKVQMPRGEGHRLGGVGDRDDSEQPMEVVEEEIDDMSDEDSNRDELPHPPLPGIAGGNIHIPYPGQPLLPRHGPHPLGMRGPRAVPGGMFMGVGNNSFDGEGHRLGGKEGAIMMGDAQRQVDMIREAAAQSAAIRSAIPTTSSTPHTITDRGPPSLEALSTRTLISASRTYGLPSCGGLSPLVAQKLLKALKNEKMLNPKTLAAFHGCPVQVMELDNYIYTTNELLSGLCYFPSLRRLSLSSCTIVTDKAVMSLLPYLAGLTHLNLNSCKQLNEIICRAIRHCKHLEVLKLSEVKVSDRGVAHLVHTPLLDLKELDLSRTQITANSLEVLPNGTPSLEVLSVEGTQVDQFTNLRLLPGLTSLNIAHCPPHCDISSVRVCKSLRSLSLVGVAVGQDMLEQLARELQLETLKLPDRNTFSDDELKAVSAFPLVSLDLMDYCHVTDVGISHVSHMTTLKVLSLSRTKLTDNGMVYLEAMTGLRELSLDNTLVSDVGIRFIARLTRLDILSLSDTRVSSQFIVDGVLDRLQMLTKLNISRTAVCDRGVTRLRLSSLIMLNVNWTCTTEQSSLEYLRNDGCPLLQVLGNSNIGQPLPGQHV